MGKILDYTDYVELLCRESDGAYYSEPSRHDVRRSARRFQFCRDEFTQSASPTERQHRETSLLSSFHDWRHKVFGVWHHVSECLYCGCTLQQGELPVDPARFREASLRYCANCGWWDTEEELHVEYPDPADPKHYEAFSIHRRGVLREFAVDGAEVPLTTLRRHLTSHPDSLHSLNPHRLERLVESVFRDFMSCEAIHLGGPGDGGIDLVLVDGEQRYVVQVKRRSSPTSAEGVAAVREFVGAMVIAGETRGIFVSTAPAFSHQAARDADGVQARGAIDYLELINGKRLLEICEITATRDVPDWARALTLEANIMEHVNTGRFEFLDLAVGPYVPERTR